MKNEKKRRNVRGGVCGTGGGPYHDGLRLERGGDFLGSLGAVESDGDARRTLCVMSRVAYLNTKRFETKYF